MNKQNIEKPSYLHLVLIALAVGFCLYAVVMTFSSMTKDAPNRDEYITKQRLANVNTALNTEVADNDQTNDLENKDFSEVDLATEVSYSLGESNLDEFADINKDGASALLNGIENPPITEIQKTVVLLDENGVLLGKVCFEAESEDVFMTYGWRGLASKALYYKNEQRKVDDIKIEVNDNCEQEVLEGGFAVKLVHNPLAVPVSENIF